MANLVATVHVYDADGVAHVFGPGGIVPEWAVKLIPNVKAWGSAPSEAAPVVAAPIVEPPVTSPPAQASKTAATRAARNTK